MSLLRRWKVFGGELNADCPKCGGQWKLYYNIVRNVGVCHKCHHTIHSRKDFEHLFQSKLPGGLGGDAGPRLLEGLPDDLQLPCGAGEAYLMKRGVISKEDREGFLWSPSKNALFCPVWSPDPTAPPTMVYRTVQEGSFWRVLAGAQRVHYVYVAPQFDPGDLVILVEGIWDVLAGKAEWRKHAVALLGSSMSKPVEYWVSQFPRVRVWLDPDEAGIEGARKIVQQMDRWGKPVTLISSQWEPDDCPDKNLLELAATTFS